MIVGGMVSSLYCSKHLDVYILLCQDGNVESLCFSPDNSCLAVALGSREWRLAEDGDSC